MSDWHPSAEFAKLILALSTQPKEVNLDELFVVLGLDEEDYILNKLDQAERILRDCNIIVQPRLQDEPSDGIFLLRIENIGPYSVDDVLDQLAKPESDTLEFKSTYWCDFRRYIHQPDVTTNELKSENVKYSALKAIAGLLTTGGGTLYIGVNDEGSVLGLQPDLRLLHKKHRSVDSLINNIKTDVSQRFRDGNTVNDYLSIQVVNIEGVQILRLCVASRRRLSFLKCPGKSYQLFRRQGNRTTKVEIYEFEEFQVWRNEHILST